MDFPKSMPDIGLVNGQFVDEDITTGQAGTYIPSSWGNAVTEEILNVIEAAELVPEEGENNQLALAIEHLILNSLAGAATEARSGVAKLATELLVLAGNDDTTIVTPKKLASLTSTDARRGLVELASKAETEALSDSGRAVTPASLARITETAWVNFNGTGTVSIRDGYNVSSITDIGVALFTVNFANALANANYSATFSCSLVGNASIVSITEQLASSVSIRTAYLTTAQAGTGIDQSIVNMSIVGGR